METKYKAIFHFDNPLFELLADTYTLNAVKAEYCRLRRIACDELNPHYDEWNSEFGPHTTKEDDELSWAGGTEYCNFIRSKQEPILNAINAREATFVKLRSLEACDIGGIVQHGGEVLTTFYITIKPVA